MKLTHEHFDDFDPEESMAGLRCDSRSYGEQSGRETNTFMKISLVSASGEETQIIPVTLRLNKANLECCCKRS